MQVDGAAQKRIALTGHKQRRRQSMFRRAISSEAMILSPVNGAQFVCGVTEEIAELDDNERSDILVFFPVTSRESSN